MARAVDTATLPKETVEDAIVHIADNLRDGDLAELRASGHLEDNDHPAYAIERSWELSLRSWLILDDTSLPIGIFGVAPTTNPMLGTVWMLGTDRLEAEALSVARQTQQYVQEMHEDFPVLWNYVDARNELSIRWLEWSGFEITDAHLHHGPEDRLFYEFSRITD